MKPVLLDLFCGAGGATKGYQRAGFYVIGVDHKRQPNYCGDEFFELDAIQALETLVARGTSRPRGFWWWQAGGIAAIHASPPCQASSSLKRLNPHVDYPELIPPTRELLIQLDLPYVIENVVGSKLVEPVQLCGSSFGLPLRRHRRFETNWPLLTPPCAHGIEEPRFPVGLGSPTRTKQDRSAVSYVYGSTRYPGDLADRKAAMEIDWMTNAELTQAIPPAYAEHIGHYLLEHLRAEVAA